MVVRVELAVRASLYPVLYSPVIAAISRDKQAKGAGDYCCFQQKLLSRSSQRQQGVGHGCKWRGCNSQPNTPCARCIPPSRFSQKNTCDPVSDESHWFVTVCPIYVSAIARSVFFSRIRGDDVRSLLAATIRHLLTSSSVHRQT